MSSHRPGFSLIRPANPPYTSFHEPPVRCPERAAPIDIAVGDDDTAAGVLIRGARAADGTVLDGSCVFVDHVLARTGASSVASLAAAFDHAIDPPPTGTSPLYLGLDRATSNNSEPPPIFASARVGLTLKKGATRERQRFIARPYRFLTEPRTIKKGKLYRLS